VLSQEKLNYPLLDSPRTVRVRFRKVGQLQYISHLDLQRTFARVLVRAGIPMWYTQGFNPHAKVIFGLPLSVGAESLCEYVDLRVARDMSCEESKERLNGALTDELCVLDAYVPPASSVFADIVWATYDIRMHSKGLRAGMGEDIKNYLTTSPLMVDKKSKSGVRSVDITKLIRDIDVSVDEDKRECAMHATLCVSGADYLNPEYLITALRDRFGLLPVDDPHSEYRILRTDVWLSDGVTPFR
jgi:radical SAM-linked protein